MHVVFICNALLNMHDQHKNNDNGYIGIFTAYSSIESLSCMSI